MKKTDFPTDDMALREALRRIESERQDAPLSDDFYEKVEEKVRVAMAPGSSSHTHKTSRRVAVVVGIMMVLGGIVFAMVKLGGGKDSLLRQRPACRDSVVTNKAERTCMGTVQFDDLRLDSIVTVVAKHYGRTVCFRDEAVRQLRLSTSWKTEEPLGIFVETLNEFEGLQLTDERDTVFVESVDEEDEE